MNDPYFEAMISDAALATEVFSEDELEEFAEEYETPEQMGWVGKDGQP